ncbi:MAG TPA: phosphoribosylaminoimidazolesuccinocarboxamide synthase [Ilumatobacteraceae bacterium]
MSVTTTHSPAPAPFTDIELDLPDRRVGKVRVSYALPDDERLFITTDRLSAFDRIVAAVPYKGQVLNELAAWWFANTADIVPNHVRGVPDPNVTVGVAAQPLPVEVVVRGHITGVTSTSLWRRYNEGERTIYGYTFPEGLEQHQKLDTAIITPTTKAEHGAHDEALTCAEVVEQGLLDADLWERVQATALALFARGQQVAESAGLILADTKYEFGLDPDGQLIIIDEMHTPDSSRFWVAATYAERIARGEDPESLDKEPIRRALIEAGYGGDGPAPDLGPDVTVQTTARYINAFERITCRTFLPGSYPIEPRLVEALHRGGVL